MQFRMRTLFILIPVIAGYVSLAIAVGSWAVVAGVFFGVLFWERRWHSRLTISFAVCIALIQGALIACASVWYTDGEVCQLLAGFVVLFWSLLGTMLCRAGAFQVAAVLMAALFLPLLGRQALMVGRLALLEDEVVRIARHLEAEKNSQGKYPSDLNAYSFRSPEMKRLVAFWPNEIDDCYVISYDLYENDTTNREYSPRTGWYYYPD